MTSILSWRTFNMMLLCFVIICFIVHAVNTTSIITKLNELSNRCEVAKTEPSTPDRILYNKLPKCGSRTLWNLFEEIGHFTGMKVATKKVFHAKNVDTADEREFVNEFYNLTRGTLFHRHIYLPDFHRFGKEYPALINIIRDPVDRVISVYYFGRQMRRFQDVLSQEQRDMTIDECVERDIGSCMRHEGAISYICGQNDICRVRGPESLARAKHNLCKYYDVIGITEDMRSFVQVLEYLYPTYMSGLLNKYDRSVSELHQSTSTTIRREPSPENRKILEEAYRYEYDFYHFVKQKFYEQYEAIMRRI